MSEELTVREQLIVNDPVIVLKKRLKAYSPRMTDLHKQVIREQLQEIEKEFLSNGNQPK